MTKRQFKLIRGVWRAMLRRCENASDKAFPRYGGRGIRVCVRWHIFENFLQDMGKRKRGLTLERKDNNGHYEPENCCWASRSAQQRNRRCSVFFTVGGITRHWYEWAKLSGVNSITLMSRIRRGVPIERALIRHDAERWNKQRAEWANCLKPKIKEIVKDSPDGLLALSRTDVGKLTGWKHSGRQRIAINTLIEQGFMKVIFHGRGSGGRLPAVYKVTA